MSISTVLLGLASIFLTTAKAANLTLSKEYSGSTFFNDWTYIAGTDTNTTGNVLFQTREQATDLTYINSDGNAIIKVDNTTSGVGNSTYGRASIKIMSNDKVSQGSLVVMDAVHVPYGCSVWPAFWMSGSNWPYDGEIDVFENVNLASYNRYTLHTTEGCTHPDNSSSSSIETGTLITADCNNATNSNEGCVVQDPSTKSYGSGFANYGGGVFAALWNADGIKTWFFDRSSIPDDIDDSPNPDNWTTPTAFWPTSSCDVGKYFGDQTLIFDITLCGNFAGEATVFAETCSGTCTDLIQDPTNYNNAYFEVSYVRVFTGDSTSSAESRRFSMLDIHAIGTVALISSLILLLS